MFPKQPQFLINLRTSPDSHTPLGIALANASVRVHPCRDIHSICSCRSVPSLLRCLVLDFSAQVSFCKDCEPKGAGVCVAQASPLRKYHMDPQSVLELNPSQMMTQWPP